MPFHTPQPISKPPKCPPTPRPQPTQPQLPSPPHYNLTPTPPHPFFASLAARLAYTSEPRFLPNGELTRPDPMPSYIPVHSDDRLPPHPRPASLSSWNPVRRSERRREAKSDFTTSTMEGRVEKKKGREEARVGAGLRQMELALRPKCEAGRGQKGHAGWHPCEHTATAEREQQRVQGRESEGSNGNITTPRESGRVGKKGEKYVRCMCCGREYQAKSPAELKPDTKLSICGDCGRKMGVEHGETEEMEL